MTLRYWIDAATALPLKRAAYDPSGAEFSVSYWTYDPQLLQTSQLPADHFSVPRPGNAMHDKTVRYLPYRPNDDDDDDDDIIDDETGASFSPYDLGDTVTVRTPEGDDEHLCLRSLAEVNAKYASGDESVLADPDEDLAPDPAGPETFFVATYRFCDDDDDDDDDARLQVISSSSASSLGAATRSAYMEPAQEIQAANEGTAGEGTEGFGGAEASPDEGAGTTMVSVEGTSSPAYVLPDGDGSTALLSDGSTEIVIHGPFDKSTLDALAMQLEVR